VKSTVIVLMLAGLVVAAAAVVAGERLVAARAACSEREEVQLRLRKAVLLAGEHPASFGPGAAPAGADASLKTLVQESAATHSVTIGYLSENDRDLEKGRRERQVVVRLTQASHPNLVLFLQELETKGAGARVKELHVRPSRDAADAYEEAEILLARFSLAREERKP
jgi:hypothetical protein